MARTAPATATLPPLMDRLLDQVRREPGRTATQLATALFGEDAVVSRVQFSLAVLESRDAIRRESEGGRRDPYRYRPSPDAPEA